MCTLLRHSEPMRARYDIILGLLDREPAAYTPPDWVDVRELDCGGSMLASIKQVRALHAAIRPDVALSFLNRANVANVLAARGACVISERSNASAHLPGLRNLPARTLVRWTYRRADKVIAVSAGVADDLEQNFGVPSSKLVSIANPIDVEAITAKAAGHAGFMAGGDYVLAVGRLVKSKNFELLIRAYAQAGLKEQLVILGEGGERPSLEALAREVGVADRVMLPGFMANPYPLMRRAKLFVLSSNDEGFPNALVEAMALGTPVIATNCASGPSEILAESTRDCVTGVAFAQYGVLTPTNDVASMVQALRAMDAPRRADYAARAAARARAFGPEIAAERYWRVMEEAIA
jgi:N-acetylgalactosamine-N,N'-diacetylbacillosaminyl-diphospho-undecaprenol 4-alpha-N-acetylgalactosaminyltransferase